MAPLLRMIDSITAGVKITIYQKNEFITLEIEQSIRR
jgi:hypothetical protein